VSETSGWDWYDERCEHGRQLVESGEVSPVSLPDWYDVRIYRGEQLRIADRCGGCEACGESQLIRLDDESVVCRRTFKPCKRLQVSSLVDFYSGAFK